MSEAPDAQTDDFDTEFANARAAEFEGADDAPAPEEGEDAAPEGEDGEQPEPIVSEADKVTKRLRDTQRALKAERVKRQNQEQEFNRRLAALEKSGPSAAVTPEALLAALRDDDEDPINDIASLKKLAKVLVGQTAEDAAAQNQTAMRDKALNTVATTMKEYEDDFKELNPDYDKAAQHFMTARMEELKDTGLDGAQLNVAMQNDFAGIVTRSIAAGKDPAEIIYNMSLRRGFQAQKTNAKLETIQRGQAASRSLPGGGTSTGALSAGKVAELSGAAFDAAFEKLRTAERRR